MITPADINITIIKQETDLVIEKQPDISLTVVD